MKMITTEMTWKGEINNQNGREKVKDQKEVEPSDEKIEKLSAFLSEKSKTIECEREEKDHCDRYPQEKIAEHLGISKKMLQNKIYGSKPLTRDMLIAICAAYGLNGEDTDHVLKMKKFAELDLDDVRDYEISEFLRKKGRRSAYVADFNEHLLRANVEQLVLPHRESKDAKQKGRNKKTNRTNATKETPQNNPYREFRRRTLEIIGEEWMMDDPYNSLSSKYIPPERYTASAYLENELDRFRVNVGVDESGFILSTKINDEFFCFDKIDDIEEEPIRDIAKELLRLAKKERRRIYDMFLDTINFMV